MKFEPDRNNAIGHESIARVLIMAAVPAEREAIVRGLGGHPDFEVLLAGVGPIAAAANTARILAVKRYDLVVSAGIGGGFAGRADVGSLVVADKIIAADLGAETPDGFLSLDELGFGSSTIIQVDHNLASGMTEAFSTFGLPAKLGPILTVSTVTGTQATAIELEKRVPGAAAEAMEGYGVAVAAQVHGMPILEIRAISNPVGPRDRSAWRMKEAFGMLESASKVLQEVLR